MSSKPAEKKVEKTQSFPKIMVFRPTIEEMKDFSKYLEKMESEGAHLAGLAKVIPPPEWKPRKEGYENIKIAIKSPIQQIVTGSQGAYQQYNIQKRSMSFREFKRLADSPKYCTPEFFDYDDLERKYWKNLTYNSPIYGADVPGTLTDPDCKEFNINNLNTILDMINETYGVKIEGVNTAYLYFGMWKSTFAWHTEDMDLYSINYLHFGMPKSWYCIPPQFGPKFERLAISYFNDLYEKCPAFLRHKMTLISPQILKKYSIPFNKITQESGEFMITFPYAYHAGYNHGFNCAESTNFALPRWVEFGKRATRCLCQPDSVKISMDVFVHRFQPDRYDNWLEGKDIGPDPKDAHIVCAAPSPYALNDEIYTKSKTKRLPKRQLIQNEDGIAIECELEASDPFFNFDDDTEDKNFKSRKKKSKNDNLSPNSDASSSSLKMNDEQSDELNMQNVISLQSDILSSDAATLTSDINDLSNYDLPTEELPLESANQNDGDKIEISHFSNNPSIPCNSNSLSQEKETQSLDELSRRTLQYTENPTAYDDEVKFNLLSSLIEPHCAVCTMLKPFALEQNGNIQVDSNSNFVPTSSPVLIPKEFFISKIKQTTYLENIESESCLLICSSCKICVHSVCYGVAGDVDRENWKCDRCIENCIQADCCLCPLRGGPLKMTTCNQWAHITCSLMLPNVKFETDINLKPIDISEAQLFRRSDRIHCKFCQKKSNFSYISNYITGFCIRCSCNNYFHITCGYREGVTFEIADQSTLPKITCRRCKKKNGSRKALRNLCELELQTLVVAKCEDLYTYAKVIDIKEVLFHRVHFVDNTSANYIKSCDILNRDCERDLPQIGDTVEVIWNKNQLHGKYIGNHLCKMYTVNIDDKKVITLKREDLYLTNEDLPKRVQMKFVHELKSSD